MNNDKRKGGVGVATVIVSGGCVVRWLTQGVGDDRWLVFAFMAVVVGAAASIWLERKQ